MTTVTFNISEDVKNAFNEMFLDQNTVISNLMLQAIDKEKTRRKRVQAIEALLALRPEIPPVTSQEIVMARYEGRS
jgi:predicted transcriptional regulator